MKTFAFLLIIAFTFFLFSGNSDYYSNGKDEKSQEISYYIDTNNSENRASVGKLIFTEDDIEWFKVDSIYTYAGEIKFTNLSTRDLDATPAYLFDSVVFVLNGILIFDPPIRMTIPASNMIYNDLQIYCDVRGDKFMLFEYYRDHTYDLWMPADERERLHKEYQDNSIMRRKQLDVFIKYLNDTGKLIGNTTNFETITTLESDAVSIYPNPTTGELKIENGELKIQQISVLDLMGNKLLYLERASGEVDISHLPSGIYFVQITTEKGVVTKKVLKR